MKIDSKFLENIRTIKNKIEKNNFFSNIIKKIDCNTKLAFFLSIFVSIIVHFAVYANDIHNADCLAIGVYNGFNRWEISLRKMGINYIKFT